MKQIRMSLYLPILVWLWIVSPIAPASWAAEESNPPYDPSRWEKNIQAFEAKDKEKPPALGGILFVGSSSIRLWDTEKCFPGLGIINRGFGGSQMEDSVYYAPRIVLPYQPKTIAVYAGDNDIQSGKTPQAVLKDFQQFVKIVHHSLPETRIVYIAIKPSISRWDKVDRMREANHAIRAFAEATEGVEFADIDTPMIGEDGRPRPSLFRDDGLHLNEEGYALWTKILRPFIVCDPKPE